MAKDQTVDRGVSVVAKAATAAARDIARGATAEELIVGVVAATFPDVVSAAWTTTREWARERTARWWAKVQEELGSDQLRDEVDARLLRERAGSPGVVPRTSIVIMEACAALNRNPDDAVLPAIAALTARYTREDTGPDWFFRALSRVLSDLNSAGLDDLRQVAETSQRFESPGVDLQPVLGAMGWELHQAHEEYEDGDSPRHIPLALVTEGHLALILRQHGLGWPSASGGGRRSAMRCFLDREVMAKVLAVVGQSQATPA